MPAAHRYSGSEFLFISFFAISKVTFLLYINFVQQTRKMMGGIVYPKEEDGAVPLDQAQKIV
jgi:hypothetical protein